MAIKYLVPLIVLFAGSVVFYLGVDTEDATNSDKTSTEILTKNDAVKSSSLSTYNAKLNINNLEDKQVVEDKKKAVPLNANNTFTREFKNKVELTRRNPGLQSVLQSVPTNYHSIFSWKGTRDELLISEYNKVIESEVVKSFDKDLERHLSDFIYQHELSIQIALEHISCEQGGCVIYGTELQSGIWNQLIENAKSQHWWGNSKETTRSSVGSDGNLIFFSLIR